MKRERLIGSVVLFLFFVSCVGQAFGQVPVVGITPPKSNGGSLGGTKEAAPGNVTMDFKEADITNVLRILSYKGGVNIVAGPEVEGLVTIRLTDVPWEKALDVDPSDQKTLGYLSRAREQLSRSNEILGEDR